ncbi:MAG: hypothetical protein ACRD1W_03300, partial [Vicinamibacterales bacterium]
VDATAMMAENSYYIDQVLTQNGSSQRSTMYFTSVRPLYAFTASLAAPLVGVLPALGLLNYGAWAVMAAAAWRFTRIRTQDSRAAFFAVLMTAAGLGAAIHIHDYSPHLFPFAIYYIGVLMLYESRVWANQRPLSTHLRIGLLLALASLAYSIGLVMTAAYVLIALRHNRRVHVAAAAALGVSSQYVWTLWLNVVQSVAVGTWNWTNVQGVEQIYMRQSLADWLALTATPLAFLARIWEGVLQFSNFEFAPLVIAGVICWCVLRRNAVDRWFDVTVVSLPFLAGLVYLNRSTTRGYLVYGVSIILYAVLAEAFGRGLRSGRPSLRIAAGTAASVLIAGQLIWSTGYLWGYIVPAKIFFGFGYRDWMAVFLTQFQPPPALSLTGAEPTPILFGGASSLRDAGLYVPPPATPLGFSPLFALVYRAPIALYLLAFTGLSTGTMTRLRALTMVAAATWIAPAVLPRVLAPDVPAVFSTFYALRLEPGQSWRYSIDVGDQFISRLNSVEGATQLQFMVPGLNPPFSATVTAGNGQLLASTTEGAATFMTNLPFDSAVDAIASSHRIDVTISARPRGDGAFGVGVFGWQRAGLRGRSLVAAAGERSAPTLPAFEVRLLDPVSRPLLIGF